jgi:hypothetical protein
MTRKLPTRRPKQPPAPRQVRLRKEEALELQRISIGGDLEASKRHLRFLRPSLDEVAVHEVAWRCEDPRSRGGVQTGTDEQGEYADLLVTGQ